MRLKALIVGVLVALLHGVLPARAQPAAGTRTTPDGKQVLISKDVGNERWAITYNLDDKTVTGNVFPISGGAPTFLTCDITRVEQAPNPVDAQYYLSCRASGPCATAPCDPGAWSAASDVGPIPGSFLLPTNTASTYAGNVQPIYNVSCATSAVCHGGGAQYVVLSTAVSYENTFLVESNGVNGMQGPFITPFLPDASFLYKKLDGTGAGEIMPYNGSPLPAEQIEAVRRWIVEGAANN